MSSPSSKESTVTFFKLSPGKGFWLTFIFLSVSVGLETLVGFDFRSVWAKTERLLINNNKSKKNICLTVFIKTRN